MKQIMRSNYFKVVVWAAGIILIAAAIAYIFPGTPFYITMGVGMVYGLVLIAWIS